MSTKRMLDEIRTPGNMSAAARIPLVGVSATSELLAELDNGRFHQRRPDA